MSIKDLNKLIKQAQNAGLTYEQGKNGRCRLVSPTGEFYQLQTNSSIHDQRSLLNTEAGIRRLIKKSGLEPTALSSKAGKHGLVR